MKIQFHSSFSYQFDYKIWLLKNKEKERKTDKLAYRYIYRHFIQIMKIQQKQNKISRKQKQYGRQDGFFEGGDILFEQKQKSNGSTIKRIRKDLHECLHAGIHSFTHYLLKANKYND
ncbi:hypothetical protein ABPG74_014683 [Tetrahymena malaccensis]